MRAEYDFQGLGEGIRGKFHGRAVAGSNVVVLEPDVAAAFPDADSVHRALRLLMEIASGATTPRKAPVKRPRSTRSTPKKAPRGTSRRRAD